MMRAGAGALLATALAAALALRLARLDVRPMHHDEANQAVKFGALLERGDYTYDAHDHHGPTLYYLTLPAAALRGQTTLASLDERTLRAVPALFGAATVLLILLLSGAIAGEAIVAGVWLMALSPAMVFYSRMFIQESLFACFTLAFAIALGRVATAASAGWPLLAGVAAGLAIATKETSIIMLPAAIAACVLSWWSLRREWQPGADGSRRWGRAALVSGAAAAVVAALFYSSFLTAPEGVLGPVRAAATYLERGVEPANHAHPWHYYFTLLAYSSAGGLWWSEAPVLALVVVGAAAAWLPLRHKSAEDVRRTFWARYLTCHAAIAAAMFSAIPYKTPWNLLPFYAAAILVAGIGFARLIHSSSSRAARAAVATALLIASVHLGWQAWRASITYASDPRNPYVYAQTVPDAVRMATRIQDLAAVHPDGMRMQVAVIASPYEQWPLPWYLRAMPHVGYWTAAHDALAMPAPSVVVASMDHALGVEATLGERYVSEFFGLRPEVLLTVYIERGLWERFLARRAGET